MPAQETPADSAVPDEAKSWNPVLGLGAVLSAFAAYLVPTRARDQAQALPGVPPLPRRAILQGASILGAGAAATRADAWCGNGYPSWAYLDLPFTDGRTPARGGQVYLRVVGQAKRELTYQGLPVLLIPGGPLLSHASLETLEALGAPPEGQGRSRRVISYDPLGSGQSKGGAPATTVAEAAEEVAEALQVLDLQGTPLHLVAHGTGAATALELSARLPTASLVLASPLWGRNLPTPPAVDNAHPALGPPEDPFFRQRLLGMSDNSPPPFGTTCLAPSALGEAPTSDAVATLRRAVEAYDPAPALARLKAQGTPVLVTQGGPADLVTPKAAADIAKAAGGTVATFPMGGHFAHLSTAPEYVQTLLDFLRTAEPR